MKAWHEELVLITEVCLKNFKSIRHCQVKLGELSILVGPNGSGKSNFLDSLRLVRDSLQQSLDQAVRSRGGWSALRYRGAPVNAAVEMSLHVTLGDEEGAWQVALEESGDGVVVRREYGRVGERWFLSEGGSLQTNVGFPMPPVVGDRLYLVNAASVAFFRPLYDALRGMHFYHLNPEQMRRPQTPTRASFLDEDGSNIASVIAQWEQTGQLARVEDYLRHIVDGVQKIRSKNLTQWVALEFEQQLQPEAASTTFGAVAMSEGTLRSLGVLVGLFGGGGALVGVEEPEAALHPAGIGLLRDALIEASQQSQVLVTTHSADLLDSDILSPQSLIAVHLTNGETCLGPVDEACQAMLTEKLYTAGELLRMDQLRPSVVDSLVDGTQGASPCL